MYVIGVIVSSMLMISVLEAAPSVMEQKKSLSEIRSTIELNRQKLKPKKARKKIAEKQLLALRRELRYTELELKEAKRQLRSTLNKERKTKKQLSDVRQQFQKNKQLFESRVVEMYKSNQLGMIELFFLPNSLIEVTEASYYFDKILEKDIQVIDELKHSYEELDHQKKLLNKQRQKVVSLKSTIVQQKKALNRKKSKQQQYISKLSAQIVEVERRNKELEKASQALAKFIRQLGEKNTLYFGTGKMIKPVKGWLSSRFGMRKHPIFKKWLRHNGIDIAARKGTRIYAADSGKVLFSGQKSAYRGYGKIVVIDHGKRQSDQKNISTFYAHQSRILVKTGQLIEKGDEIGWVGDTGYATGPHLHFEVRENGKPVDPLKYISR